VERSGVEEVFAAKGCAVANEVKLCGKETVEV
jgi:hypothetical protein